MHDALGVGLAQTVTDLLSELDALAGAECVKAVQHAPQAFAFNEFHGDEGGSVAAVEIVDAAYVLMRDFSSKPQFVLEAFQRSRRIRDLGLEDFERHKLSSFAIAGFEDNARDRETGEQIGRAHV